MNKIDTKELEGKTAGHEKYRGSNIRVVVTNISKNQFRNRVLENQYTIMKALIEIANKLNEEK